MEKPSTRRFTWASSTLDDDLYSDLFALTTGYIIQERTIKKKKTSTLSHLWNIFNAISEQMKFILRVLGSPAHVAPPLTAPHTRSHLGTQVGKRFVPHDESEHNIWQIFTGLRKCVQI